MNKRYMYCLKCGRWCYAHEKIHCWTCPVCMQILDYKPVVGWENPPKLDELMSTKGGRK